MSFLSTGEFKRYISGNKFSKIVFNSEDQTGCALRSSIYLHVEFSAINVSLCPDEVHLSGKCGVLCLNNLTKVELDDSSSVGAIVHFTCKSNECISRYSLLFI